MDTDTLFFKIVTKKSIYADTLLKFLNPFRKESLAKQILKYACFWENNF